MCRTSTFLILLFTVVALACKSQKKQAIASVETESIKTGAENMDQYLPLLKGKRVACVVNHASKVKSAHLVDTLIHLGVNLAAIFTPEHGLKGTADAGEHVDNSTYKNIKVISLYGNNKKPSEGQLENIDIVLFDLQDVGVRFYTYISTLHYVMEACAEKAIPLVLLDRPNPHAHYIDGPVLKKGFGSFIGMHQVPVVYGMTIGEYGSMINGEHWLPNGLACTLIVISCKGYKRKIPYYLPLKPSPNLPDKRAIQLYPSICFFEGTVLSLGRGTDKQFQVVGHPSLTSDFSFTPKPNEGAKDPVLNGKICFGRDYSNIDVDSLFNVGQLDLEILLSFYHQFPDKEGFFLKNNFFDKLAGTDELRHQIINGQSAADIRLGWADDLKQFNLIRKKYLRYE